MAKNMAAMAAKWGMPMSFSSAGLTSASRDEKKGPKTSFEHVNEISLTLQGQQTVQDIVSKATVLFRYLQDVSLVVDEKSKVEDSKNKKRIQENLNSLKELFSRLRALYDGSNRRIDLPPGEDLEAEIPLTLSQTKNEMEQVTSSEVTHLQIEHDALQEKLRCKNQQIKEVIDKLRTLIWDVNTMMALKPS